jgi:hypothetical protein
MRGLGILALTCALVGGTSAAHAGLNFDFSFTNQVGTVSGTVTGEVFGLTNNSTSAATDVVIDSYPTGLLLPAAPWDIFNGPGFFVIAKNFTVTNGVVVGGDFETVLDDTLLIVGSIGESQLQDNNGDSVISVNFATFTAAPVGTPEPASIALFLSGLFGLFGLRLIRRRPGSRIDFSSDPCHQFFPPRLAFP